MNQIININQNQTGAGALTYPPCMLPTQFPAPVHNSKEQLKQIADMLVPYIENKIFGDPKIDLEEQKNWTPEQRTRFVARLIAKGGM